jgi:hypothetical protein
MAKTGRPTSYSPEIAGAICDEIASTEHGLERICRGEGMPDARSVYRWLEPPNGLWSDPEAQFH